jgi:hypothetical protein
MLSWGQYRDIVNEQPATRNTRVRTQFRLAMIARPASARGERRSLSPHPPYQHASGRTCGRTDIEAVPTSEPRRRTNCRLNFLLRCTSIRSHRQQDQDGPGRTWRAEQLHLAERACRTISVCGHVRWFCARACSVGEGVSSLVVVDVPKRDHLRPASEPQCRRARA